MVALILAVGLIMCAPAVQRPTVEQWLSSESAKSSNNVSGQWRGPQSQAYNYWTGSHHSNFGVMTLVQDGIKITGTYTEYDIIGKINGTQVTLFGLHGDVVYYTWHFTYSPKAKILMGKMCDGYYPKVEPHCYNLSLEKL